MSSPKSPVPSCIAQQQGHVGHFLAHSHFRQSSGRNMLPPSRLTIDWKAAGWRQRAVPLLRDGGPWMIPLSCCLSHWRKRGVGDQANQQALIRNYLHCSYHCAGNRGISLNLPNPWSRFGEELPSSHPAPMLSVQQLRPVNIQSSFMGVPCLLT